MRFRNEARWMVALIVVPALVGVLLALLVPAVARWLEVVGPY